MTRPAVGLALLLIYSILTIFVEESWAWNLLETAAFLSLAVWCAVQIWRPSPVRLTVWLIPLCAAPLWGLLQLACGQTIYRWGTWTAILTWSTWAVLFFLSLQILAMPAARLWFLRAVLYFGAALSILATVQMFTSGGKIFWLFPSGYTKYVLGPFVNRNQYAAFLEMLLPIALWQAIHNRREALAHCAIAGAMLASVIAAAARAGAALMCAEVLIVLLLSWRRGALNRNTALRGLAAFTAMAVIFTAIVGWQPLRQRFLHPDPSDRRLEIWAASLEMLQDRPLFGFGLGNWARGYPHYATYDDGTYVNQAHNDWLQWSIEGGLPFFAIMLALAVMATPAAVRSIWGIGLLSVWLHALIDYPFQQRPALGAWFFVLLGALAASRHSREREV